MLKNIIKNMSETIKSIYKYFFKKSNKYSTDHDQISKKFVIDEEDSFIF
jgi:hypothetical protein